MTLSIADKVKLAASVAELSMIVSLISDMERRMPVALRHAEEELNVLSMFGGEDTEQIAAIRNFLKGIRDYHGGLYAVAHNTSADVSVVLAAIRRLDFIPTPAVKPVVEAEVKAGAAKAVVAAGGVK